MRCVAIVLVLAAVSITTAANAQTSGSSGATPASITEANVAGVAFAQALVWQQWLMLSAIDAYARDPNVSPEQLEAARREWLTNGGAMMTVPTSGPAARWFTNGADVLSTPPAPPAPPATPPAADAGAASPQAEVDAGEDAYAEDAPMEDAPPESEVPEAMPLRVLATPTIGPEADAQAVAAPPAEPPGGATSSPTPPAPTAAPNVTPPNADAPPRASRVALESRGWLVAPAAAALALFVAALFMARRARAH